MILSVPMRALAAAVGLSILGAGCADRRADLRLVLLISVDTLRADHLGAYGHDLDLTPRIDELAEKSQIFEWAFAPTSFTLPSVASLLTGRYPQEIGIRSNRSALQTSIPTLATVLKSRGWRTAAVVSNLVLNTKSGLARGFETYDDDLPDREVTWKWPERNAEDTTRAAIGILDGFSGDRGERLFLWVHYQDPHGPYTPPDGWRDRFLAAERARPDGDRRLPPESGHRGRGHLPGYQSVAGRRDVAFYRAGYDAEIHHLDGEVGRLLDRVRSRGFDASSLIVFTADHGESLGENDYWFAHGDRLDDVLVRIPLMIRVPSAAPRLRSDVVSLVDLFPTILARLFEDLPETPIAGRDLLAADAMKRETEPLLATLDSGGPRRVGIVAAGHKLVVTQAGRTSRRELYRLGAEDEDLASVDPQRLEQMSDALRHRFEALHGPVGETRRTLDERDRENLRSLGYLDDEPTDEAP